MFLMGVMEYPWSDGTREPVAERSVSWGKDPVTEIILSRPSNNKVWRADKSTRPRIGVRCIEAPNFKTRWSHFILGEEKMEETTKRYIGIDLAKRTFLARIESSDGNKPEVFQGTTSKPGIEKLLSRLRPTDRIGMECCAFAFYLAKEMIRKVGCEVYVLNAGQLAIIYKSTKKTDMEDAAKITWLLHRFPVEELPVVTLPTEKDEQRRALVSELRFKKRQRNRLINRLHSLFVRLGITVLQKKDLRTAKSRKRREELLNGYTLAEACRIDEELGLLETHISTLEQEITEDLKTEPLAKNLLSVPGVGPATAMAFLAHVGDGSRFTSGRQVSYFVGMTPRVDISGDTIRLGNITKRGCTAIRSLIVQSAWAAVHAKTPNRLQNKYLELADRRGKGRAIVAIARRLLEIMWLVIVRKELYNQTSQIILDRKLLRLGLMKREEILGPAA
jgi:transposase